MAIALISEPEARSSAERTIASSSSACRLATLCSIFSTCSSAAASAASRAARSASACARRFARCLFSLRSAARLSCCCSSTCASSVLSLFSSRSICRAFAARGEPESERGDVGEGGRCCCAA